MKFLQSVCLVFLGLLTLTACGKPTTGYRTGQKCMWETRLDMIAGYHYQGKFYTRAGVEVSKLPESRPHYTPVTVYVLDDNWEWDSSTMPFATYANPYK